MHVLCNENGLKPVLVQIPAMLAREARIRKFVEDFSDQRARAFPFGVNTSQSRCLG